MFDVLQYGFKLSEDKDGLYTYEKKIADMTIILLDCNDMFTLYYYQGERKTDVANRYIVENQDQLDFIIYNGRLGYLFRPTPM